jgi:hypothetical protein
LRYAASEDWDEISQDLRNRAKLKRRQFRKSNAVFGEKGKTPSLVDRDLGDRYPAVPIQDFASAQQVQLIALEQSLAGLLNFGAHSLKSGIDCVGMHNLQKYCSTRARSRWRKSNGIVTILNALIGAQLKNIGEISAFTTGGWLPTD